GNNSYGGVGQGVLPMLFVEALGRPIAFFHNFPLAIWRRRWRIPPRNKAKEMARQVAQPFVRSMLRSLSRDPAAWRDIAASSLPRRETWTVRCPRAFWANGGR